VGFAKPARFRTAGALLPHLFTLAAEAAVSFLWHFPSLTGPRATGHTALWSSDFPPSTNEVDGDRPSACQFRILCVEASSAIPPARESGIPEASQWTDA
jgi:hypothetical protein